VTGTLPAGGAGSGPLYLDTAFWFAAIVPRDARHAECRAVLDEALRSGRRLVTTVLVVAEVHALLVGRASHAVATGFLELLEDPQLEVVHPDAALIREAVARGVRPAAGRLVTLTDAVGLEVMRREREGLGPMG
jgi:predicted nucleic acid-binding protein